MGLIQMIRGLQLPYLNAASGEDIRVDPEDILGWASVLHLVRRTVDPENIFGWVSVLNLVP